VKNPKTKKVTITGNAYLWTRNTGHTSWKLYQIQTKGIQKTIQKSGCKTI